MMVHNLLHDVDIVVLVIVCAYGIVCHIHLLAKVPFGRVGEERTVAGCLECEHPSFLTSAFGFFFRCIDGTLGQTFQICLVRDVQCKGILVLQLVLRELQGEDSQFGCELAIGLLVFFLQIGTIPHETVVAGLEQHPLLLRESFLVGVFIHALHTLEQFFVERDVVLVLRE